MNPCFSVRTVLRYSGLVEARPSLALTISYQLYAKYGHNHHAEQDGLSAGPPKNVQGSGVPLAKSVPHYGFVRSSPG